MIGTGDIERDLLAIFYFQNGEALGREYKLPKKIILINYISVQRKLILLNLLHLFRDVDVS